MPGTDARHHHQHIYQPGFGAWAATGDKALYAVALPTYLALGRHAVANVGVIANYPLFHGFYPNGDPLIGGKLYTYEAGTSTPAAAYHDAAATMPHQNPITLDDRGEALVHIAQAMLWRWKRPPACSYGPSITFGMARRRAVGTIPPSTVGVDHLMSLLALSPRSTPCLDSSTT